jgi:signal transduction protein with GAF and PtsI domain
MDTQNFFVALYHPDEDKLSFHHVIADNQLVNEEHPEWSFWGPDMPVEGLTGHVIRSKQPLLVEENALQRFKEIGLEYVEIGGGGVQSWLGVPMKLGEQVLGVIAVQSEVIAHLYTQHHLNNLTTVGNQAAIAIANARLLEETRQRNDDLAVINAIIEAASGSLNLETTLLEILDEVIHLTGYQSGLVSTIDNETEELTLTAQRHLPETLIQSFSSQGLSATLCEMVYKRGE